jgi:hypothetical protein
VSRKRAASGQQPRIIPVLVNSSTMSYTFVFSVAGVRTVSLLLMRVFQQLEQMPPAPGSWAQTSAAAPDLSFRKDY